MPNSLSIKKSTSRILLSYVQREYDENISDLKDIERKAQGTIAIAAIFITGIVLSFRFFQEEHSYFILYLGVPLFILMICVTKSMSALNVTTFKGIEGSERVYKEANRIFDECNIEYDEYDYEGKDKGKLEARVKARSEYLLIKKKLCEFVNDRADRWMTASKDLENINTIKVKALAQSQKLLLHAIYAIGIGMFMVFGNYAYKLLTDNNGFNSVDTDVKQVCLVGTKPNNTNFDKKKSVNKNSPNKFQKPKGDSKKPCK